MAEHIKRRVRSRRQVSVRSPSPVLDRAESEETGDDAHAALLAQVKQDPAHLRHALSQADAPTRAVLVQRLQQAQGNQATQRLLTGHSTPLRGVGAGGAGLQIQRWDSPEHVNLGDTPRGGGPGLIILDAHNQDFPERTQPQSTWPPAWRRLLAGASPEQRRAVTQGLSYGEIVALSGDFYASFDALNRAPLREIFDLIPLIRNGATTAQLQAATGGRYLALAQQNESHFSHVRPGHRNIDVWARMHIQAIEAARQGNANLAWGLNAAADHYLTDAFSGGHILTPRAALMGSAPGNIQSKILHDLDNENGVEVNNARGDGPWIAYGDDMLTDPRNVRNRTLAQEAVQLSQQDIAAALAQRAAYPQPGPGVTFQAEQLVPFPVGSGMRWTPLDLGGVAGSVAAREGPGVLAGLSTDDNEIRAWVARQSRPALGRQPVDEKIRMIQTLLNGWVDDTDLDAIQRICESVTDGGEMEQIRRAIQLRVGELTSIGQRTRLRVILSRTP